MTSFEASLGPKLIGAELLVHIAKQKLSGTLSFGPPAKTYRLTFCDGRPEAGSAPDGADLEQRAQVVAVVRACATTCSGRGLFEAATAAPAAGHGIDTLGETLVALLKHLAPAQLDAFWQTRGGLTVQAAAPLFARLASAAAQLGGVTLAPPSPGTRFGDLAPGSDPAARRGWTVMLVMGGLVTDAPALSLNPVQQPTPAVAQAHEAVSPNDDSDDSEAGSLARQIRQMHAKLDTLDHYELLGVARDASAEAVRKSYLALARRWHSDQLRGLGVSDEVIAQAEDLFRRVDEAKKILCDPEQRESYDWVLDRQSRGLPTDPAVIFEADSLFRQGRGLLERGQAAAAEPLLRKATEMNPGEAEFWAHFGYAVYGVKGGSGCDEAREALGKALQMNEKLDVAHEFLGRMTHAEGLVDEAREHLNRALARNPKNRNAERELRLLNMREQDKPADKKGKAGKSTTFAGGLLGRLRRG